MEKKQLYTDKFSKRLKQLMEENNETVYSLSAVVNLSPSTISRYTKGKMSPKIPTIQILAEYFCVNPSWLMGTSEERNTSFAVDEADIDKKISAMYENLNLFSKNKLFHFMKKILYFHKKKKQLKLKFQLFLYLISYYMYPPIGLPAGIAGAFLSGNSATTASVVRNVEATDVAF